MRLTHRDFFELTWNYLELLERVDHCICMCVCDAFPEGSNRFKHMYMSKGHKILCGDVVLGCLGFLWGARGNLEEQFPLKSCKYVVMAICLHVPNQQKLLGTMPAEMQFDTWTGTPNQQKWATASGLWRAWQKSIQNSFGKSRPGACACKCVLDAKMACPTCISISFQLLYQQRRTLSEQFPV